MSVKHVNYYFNQISEQYNEMLENIHDAEKDLSNDEVTEEYVENLKKIIAPLKENYERWSYMMFLLHQPQRPEKKKKYTRTIASKLKSLNPENSIDSTIEAGEQVLKNIKHNS